MGALEKKCAIIGAGPSGLFCALELARAGWKVDLHERKDRPGLKLLLAGSSGLNISRDENPRSMSLGYGKNQERFAAYLAAFGPADLRAWLDDYGISTEIGTSRRIFPSKLDVREILKLWMDSLAAMPDFTLHTGAQFTGFDRKKNPVLADERGIHTVIGTRPVIFALGGGSYPETGSDGSWLPIFRNAGITVDYFRPMNCGFEIPWSPVFREQMLPSPLKNISLRFRGVTVRGDIMITPYGIEGGPVYVLSREIRESLDRGEHACVELDLAPDLDAAALAARFLKQRDKMSLSNYLRKILQLDACKLKIIYECLDENQYHALDKNPQLLKALPLVLAAPRPLEEAISSSGGLRFEELTDALEIRNLPGMYATGEMVDWDAPTGGYLLQGCFSMSWHIVRALTAPMNPTRNFRLRKNCF